MHSIGAIEHLDFPVDEEEEEKEQDEMHFVHPIDPLIQWCGKPRKAPYVYQGPGGGTPAAEVTCVDCLHLYIEKGAHWWWRVHRAWYGE